MIRGVSSRSSSSPSLGKIGWTGVGHFRLEATVVVPAWVDEGLDEAGRLTRVGGEVGFLTDIGRAEIWEIEEVLGLSRRWKMLLTSAANNLCLINGQNCSKIGWTVEVGLKGAKEKPIIKEALRASIANAFDLLIVWKRSTKFLEKQGRIGQVWPKPSWRAKNWGMYISTPALTLFQLRCHGTVPCKPKIGPKQA